MVERTGKHWRVTIDEVGTFLQDTYDFNGDQMLGSWGPDGMSRMAVAAPAIQVDWEEKQSIWTKDTAFFKVGNDFFREYRRIFTMGGDFAIFSDVRRVHLAQPVIVLMPA